MADKKNNVTPVLGTLAPIPVFEPKFNLRWVRKDNRDEIARGGGYARDLTTCYGILKDDEFFVLQQMWKDNKGNIEWRDIEIDWNV